MSEPDKSPVLRRKINLQNVLSETSGGAVTKALRQAFARAAQDSISLEVLVSGCRETRLNVEEITETLEPAHLLLLLKGPDEVRGLAVVSFSMVAAIVEHLTTGRVVPEEAVIRNATRTDAMMISGLLDDVLAVFDAELALIPDTPPAAGFRSMMVMEDPRAVSMALEEVLYRQFHVILDVARGAKSGEIYLYFPHEPPRKANFRSRELAEWKGVWRGHVMQMEVPVEAVIHRMTMSLEEITSLEVGSIIPVPVAKISAISLEGVDCHSFALGKLGQYLGNRAIRIVTPIKSDVLPIDQLGKTVQQDDATAPPLSKKTEMIGAASVEEADTTDQTVPRLHAIEEVPAPDPV